MSAVILIAQATSAPTDPVVEACGLDRDPWLCRWLADTTNSATAGDIGRVLSPLVTVALVVVVAILVSRI